MIILVFLAVVAAFKPEAFTHALFWVVVVLWFTYDFWVAGRKR